MDFDSLMCERVREERQKETHAQHHWLVNREGEREPPTKTYSSRSLDLVDVSQSLSSTQPSVGGSLSLLWA